MIQINQKQKKNPDNSGLVNKTDYNTKITEIEGKSSLATKTALTTVKNKIPDVSSLAKKADYGTKTTEIEKKLTDDDDKYITTSEFSTTAASVFGARLAPSKFSDKNGF